MGLREVSTNLQRPSPYKDSPYYRSVRTGSRRKSSHGKPRFNSEEYIEQIENELQIVKDAMYSPTTNISWKEKLKKAKDENDRLRKEIETLRSSFEMELQRMAEESTGTDLRLRRRIKDLEDEVELKQSLIQDLEYDRDEKRFDQSAVEILKARIDKLEEEKNSLEMTNRDMTKRNEVLTQLLAISPTKAHHSFELPTPRRKNARLHLPVNLLGADRPRSLHLHRWLPQITLQTT
jgi:chromosome segregation ATPase